MALEQIRKLGGLALELAQNDSRIEVTYRDAEGKITAEHLKPLKELKELVHLNLRGLNVTDELAVHLKDLKSLTRLHLEKTKITDKALEHLRGLTNLEYLNLYGTAVSDAGLKHLAGMKKLKKLYLWQTKVTDKGVEQLKKALPGVEVIRGFDTAPAKSPPQKPEPKKDTKTKKGK
ncbi:MAG: hypothetical protein KatS3mg105_3986 [Gemmatales bacterium]|nr:MAG: hypothetical protein KatS3mg105_3986 [Gemmatales bacterium]